LSKAKLKRDDERRDHVGAAATTIGCAPERAPADGDAAAVATA